MPNVFSFIARLRHWQLFALVTVPFCAITFLAIPGFQDKQDIASLNGVPSLIEDFTFLMLISAPFIIAIYVWIWTIGVVSNSGLKSSLRRSTRKIDIAVPVVIAYFIFAIWAWPRTVMSADPVIPVGIVVSLHMVAMVCLVYAIIYAARGISSVGGEKLSGFGRTLLFVLAILYFPIGLWWVQPRLNSIVESSKLP